MGKIISQIRFFVVESDSVTDWAKEQWTEAMMLNLNRMNQKRKRKVPDQPRYDLHIAESSVRIWKNFIDPNFVSQAGLTKKEIVAKHAKAIAKGFHKWDKHLDRMYAEDGKLYKERIRDSQEWYGKNAEIGIRLTGDRVRYYGPAVIVPKWLVADHRTERLFHAVTKVVEGRAVNIIGMPGLELVLKSALEPLLVQGGVLIIKEDFQPDTIKQQNDRNNFVIRGLQDKTKYAEFTTGGASHCDWGMDDTGLFYLEVQVSEV